MSQASQAIEAPKTFMQRLLDGVERVGNKVPHPAVIFIILIGIVIVLSHILYLVGARVSYEVINPDTHKIEKMTTVARSLLTVDGIRFMFTGVVQNFMNFQAVGVIIVAMVGVGVAEESGLVNALIRKLVVVSPPWALTYILVCVGILSSLAADAGYLVLIPLAATAFISVGRHPLAGLAAGFAGGGRRVPGERLHRARRRHPHGHHERRHPHRRSEQEHLADGEPLVLGRLGDPHDDRRRADHRQGDRAAARNATRASIRPRARRCRPRSPRAPVRVLGPDRRHRLHRPAGGAAGRAAAQSGDRGDHRQLAVHEQPDRDRRAAVLRDRAPPTASARGR